MYIHKRIRNSAADRRETLHVNTVSHEHENGRGPMSCGFLIKVTRENNANVSNLFIVLGDLYTEGIVVASAANVIGCG